MNEWQIGGGRVILIGDVHGCYRELMSLLELVEFKEDRDRVCLLGVFGNSYLISFHS